MEYYNNLDLTDVKYFCEIDQIEKIEQWLPVVGYEGLYKVSDLGRVKSLYFSKEKILKQGISNYCVVCLGKNKKSKSYNVHILISTMFLNHVSFGYDLVVNHINHSTLDNRKTNLEIITQRDNTNKKHITKINKYTGVYKVYSKWVAKIWITNKRVYLGTFLTETEARNAYIDKYNELQNIK